MLVVGETVSSNLRWVAFFVVITFHSFSNTTTVMLQTTHDFEALQWSIMVENRSKEEEEEEKEGSTSYWRKGSVGRGRNHNTNA